jgi:hypothetical protein
MQPHYLDVMSPLERLAFKALRSTGRSKLFYRGFETWHRDIPDIASYRNRHRGQRCFILGGGPSLKKIDPSKLRDEVTFAVNGIFLIYDWLRFEPNYYVVEDFLVFEDRWRDIKQKVARSTCFFPVHFHYPEFHRDNHHYLRAIYDFDPRSGFPRFSTNAARLVWIGGTVTYVCMQLAFYMGFDEVYLVGMDHNYERPGHVQSVGSVWTSHGEDPNHFHPEYFGKGYRWHDPMVSRMEVAYREAKKVFEAHGRVVKNATVGGQLEVFERVKYERLFAKH